MIEFLLLAVPTFSVITAMIFSFYAFFCKSWLDHFSYELAVCSLTYPQTETDCRQQFLDRVTFFAGLGTLDWNMKKKVNQQLSLAHIKSVKNGKSISKTL